MTFREDAEGPHDKADRLDQDLADAQRTLHEARERRLAHLEHEIAQNREHLGKMEGALRQLRDEPLSSPGGPTRASSPGFARALPLLLPVGLIAMMGFTLGHSSARRCASRAAMHARAPVTQMATQPAGVVGSADKSGTTPQVSLRWTAHVRKATGIALAAGTSCTLEADLEANGSTLTGADVSLTCGDRQLYRKGDYSGTSALMSVDEFIGQAPRSYTYNMHLEDTQRPSFDKRSQASIDTEARQAAIWRDNGQAFRVELDLDDALAETQGQAAPLYATTGHVASNSRARITRTARVSQASGASPVSSGAKCTVEIAPASPNSGWSCRTFVRCGGKPIYGEQGTGYADCSGDESSLRIRDAGYTMDDGDAKLEADFSQNKLTLIENDVQAWSVTLKLDD